jgi:predicted nucleic acid-binding protein
MAVERLLLLDKSAYARGAAALEHPGELCLCPITRLEVLYSARSRDDYAAIEADLDAFRELRVDAETFAIATTAHRELADRGQHRVSIPDVLIAACAQQHGADVVHRDRHYDVLASVLAFEPIRVQR